MNRMQTVRIGAVVLVALGIGLALVPNQKDIGLMQFSDANYAKAYDFYKTFAGPHQTRSIDVVAPLLNLKIYYGEIDAAIDILKEFLQEKPRSADGWRWLAKLYLSTQRFNLYASALEKAQQIDPAAANLRKLTETYNFLGRYDDERRVLAELVKTSDTPLLEDDYRKLAIYHRVAGDPKAAIEVVNVGLKAKNFRVGIDTAYLAVNLYLEQGQTSQAVALAEKFLGSGRQPDSAVITLADLMKSFGQVDAAVSLVQPYLYRLDRSPLLTLLYVNLLSAQNKDDVAFTLLASQFRQGKLDSTLVESLIDLALKRRETAIAFAVIDSADLSLLPDDALLRYANFAYQQRDEALLTHLSSRLEASAQNENPLLKILLYASRQPVAVTLAGLRGLPGYAFATNQQRLIAAGVYYRLGAYKDAFAAIQDMPVNAVLEGAGPLLFAELHLTNGQADEGRRKLEEATRNQPAGIVNLAEQAQTMIAAGLGDGPTVLEKLDALGTSNPYFYGDLYALARRNNHMPLALTIADHAFKASPSDENRWQLVDALTTMRNFPQALVLIRQASLNGNMAQQFYMDVMQRWIRHAGLAAVPTDEMERFTAFVLARANSTSKPEEQRGLAYLLLELGQRHAAESLFIQLARGKGFGSHDMDELLNFWGQELSPTAEDWIMAQARRATSESERVGWTKYLNDLGHPDLALDLFKPGEELSSPLSDQYIAVLAGIKDRARLKPAVESEIAKETDAARLRSLAKVATQEKFTAVAERGWRKIYAANRQDPDAARELGLLLFANRHYSEAQQVLVQARQNDPNDYRVNMAYGEILQQQRKKREAQSYFRQAITQVSENTNKDDWQEQDRARLLYRSNRINESIALFRDLLEKNPDNKSLRAELAGILIEQKQYQDANRLLAAP